MQRLVGGDKSGKMRSLDRAVDVLNAAGCAGAFADRMQHTKADTIFQKCLSRLPIHGEHDAPRGLADDFRAPGEMDVSFAMLGVVENTERVAAIYQVQVGHFGRDGAPILVPDGSVNAPDDFTVTETQVAQIAVLVNEGDRARPERHALRQGFITPMKDYVFSEDFAHAGAITIRERINCS